MAGPLCIYHGYCDDGFGAAWALTRAVPNAELYPGVYQKDPPWEFIQGREVYLVDFSYKRPVMDRPATGRMTMARGRSCFALVVASM